MRTKMLENTACTLGKHILYCSCGGERIGDEIKASVENALRRSDVKVTVLSDLCGLAILQKEKLSGLFGPGNEYMVIGCYKRTMKLLFARIGYTPLPEIREHLNLLLETVESVSKRIAEFAAGAIGLAERTEITEGSGMPSWYPVIDPARCTNCGQCADFCLFGVYEKTDTHPMVVYPQGCKSNCPACGRICPATAIIFPKYRNGGAIGGSEEIDEQGEQKRQAQDIEQVLGDDLYGALERRKTKRKSIIREEAMKRAVAERENALDSTPAKSRG